MGCTVRDKHIKASRRARSVKATSSSDVDHNHLNDKTSPLAKSMLESGLKPWTSDMGFNASGQNHVNLDFDGDNVLNPCNPQNSSTAQNVGYDNCGWGNCTDEQLVEILLKNMEFLYTEAISKLIGLGYDEDVALKAILSKGHCYGNMDVLTNILQNSLNYLNDGCSGNDGNKEDPELAFTDLKQLEMYSLHCMVSVLRQVKPQLTLGDAMRCLLMSDLHIGRACNLVIPRLTLTANGPGDAMVNVESVNSNVASLGTSVLPCLCKFHGGWGFENGVNAEPPDGGMGGTISYSETSIPREIECANRASVDSSVKPVLDKNVRAFAAGLPSPQKQMQSQPCVGTAASVVPSKVNALRDAIEVNVGSSDLSQEIAATKEYINSILNKFEDLNLDENFEDATDAQKDELIMTLLHKIQDLEDQVTERKAWALQKALQAARKLSSDLTELKILRMEKDETQRLKKGKQTLEDTTMKRLTEVENALRQASSHVDRANAAVRKLEIENAEIRAEMEASKLSASESNSTCLEVAKREKKSLKRLLAWEKQKTKMQEDIAAEKQKITGLQQQLVQINGAQKEAEEKWKKEVQEKELAMALVEEERRSKETTEGNNKRMLEALRSRIDIDFQRHKDDLQRLEQELSRLKSASLLTESNVPSDTFTGANPKAAMNQGESIARLLRELDEPDQECDGRVCMVCKRDEVSIVFLPCAHQVMCVGCGEDYGKKGKPTCPCCRVPIEQKIRVFGASS